jgi:hypothetical protein
MPGYRLSIFGTVPPPAAGGGPMVSGVIEEQVGLAYVPRATTTTGVPVAAIPVEFLDRDPDPGAPTARDFTTREASAPAGTFRVVMFDEAGNRYEFEPQLVAAASPAVPNVSEVAAHLMAYTVDRGGRRLGNFTEDTQIRGTEVERIIPLAVSRVMSKIGALPAPLVMPDGAVIDATDDFRAAAALYAAIVAANGAIPEQSSGADSAVPVLERLLTGALADLEGTIDRIHNGGVLPDPSTGGAIEPPMVAPVAYFPPAVVGFNTVF